MIFNSFPPTDSSLRANFFFCLFTESNIDKIYNQNNVPDVILFRNLADYFHILENKVRKKLNELIKHTHLRNDMYCELMMMFEVHKMYTSSYLFK